jgi:hypothetical protein
MTTTTDIDQSQREQALAALLSAISAGLVACGSAVMARTRPLTLARALATARRARRTAAACRAARRRAEEKMQRHWAVLQRVLREWSIMSDAPVGVRGLRLVPLEIDEFIAPLTVTAGYNSVLLVGVDRSAA